jgi:hypothetical protein
MDSENPSGADNQQETSLSRVQLDPAWIAGFVDGEGCFSVSIHKNDFMHRHRGWQIQAAFHVYQHREHVFVLEALRAYFDCGYVRSKGPNSPVMTYSVTAMSDLNERIIPFFEINNLHVKQSDFASFTEIVRAMRRREHLNASGFERIVRQAYSMNGLGKQRSRSLEEVLEGSSETIRQARRITKKLTLSDEKI